MNTASTIDVRKHGLRNFLYAATAILALGARAADVTPPPVPALSAPKAAENRLLDIALAGDRLIAVGQFGVILISDDASHWSQAESPVDSMLTHVQFQNAQSGWALGHDASILQTRDGGASWQIRHRDPRARALYDLLFLDERHALAVGAYGQMLLTEDGGASWQTIENELTDLGMHFNTLIQLQNRSLLVVGERGLIAVSKDEGQIWTLLDFPYEGSQFGALPYGNKGFITYGMRGNVYIADDISVCKTMDAESWDPFERTTVNGADRLSAMGWRHAPPAIKESLFGAIPSGTDSVLFLGVNGTALKLDIDNLTLRPVEINANETLSDAVSFKGRLIAVGRRGAVDIGPAP